MFQPLSQGGKVSRILQVSYCVIHMLMPCSSSLASILLPHQLPSWAVTSKTFINETQIQLYHCPASNRPMLPMLRL